MMKRIVSAVLFLALSSAFAADEYTIDAAHTQVGFSVKHMMITTVRGSFKEFSGKIFYDEKDVTKSTIEGVIKVASINTENEKRDEHLRSADFFDAVKYPDITFKSKKIVKRGTGYVAIGDLAMRGVTKELELPFTIIGKITDLRGNVRIGVEAKTKINRQDYGVSWNKVIDNGGLVVSDEVTLDLTGEFIKKK
jgi:polyisoprenoid-binding protein YceI